VRQIGRFVDELLDASRIQAGRLGLELERVDLVAVVREAMARLEPQIVASGSRVTVIAPRPVIGHWDRARIDQVATNLISNAIKFGAGQPVDINAHSDGNRAYLVIRDHGIGIAHERQESIFEPFERAVSARHYGGLGLGLYIVRKVLEAMGG